VGQGSVLCPVKAQQFLDESRHLVCIVTDQILNLLLFISGKRPDLAESHSTGGK
jgi:hypothetical protein